MHCLETINGEVYDKCDNNYFFDEEKKCVSTNYCLKSLNYECKECITDYYLTEDNTCQKKKIVNMLIKIMEYVIGVMIIII